MNKLNQVAYIYDASSSPQEMVEKLQSVGFAVTLFQQVDNVLERMDPIKPATILIDGTFDLDYLNGLIQDLKERFPYVPVVFIAEDCGNSVVSAPLTATLDAVCFKKMQPQYMAATLRGIIRSTFVIQELMLSNQKLNEISITDSLTALANRGYMMDRLSLEFKRANRNREPLSCLMIDIDHFKSINDTYGHRFGDVILQGVAKRLSALIRETDIFGRYGGEEFVLVLPHTDTNGAEFLAEKLRAGLEAEEMRHECFAVHVTASFGVACTENSDVIAADHLLQLADRALYEAKESGRNRVCIAGIKNASETQSHTDAEADKDASSVLAAPSTTRIDILTNRPDRGPLVRSIEQSPLYETAIFAKSEDFLDAFRTTSPSILVVDERNCDTPAIDLCNRIKLQIKDLFIPLILLTNRDDEAFYQIALGAGADSIIPENRPPVDFMAHLAMLSRLKEVHDRWHDTFRELTLARTRLVKAERLNALGEMASGVAHDFNNILSAILGRTQYLLQHVNDPLLKRDLDVIERAANDGAATIRRIQEFARMTTDGTYQIVDMAQIVRDCVQMTRTRWKDASELRGIRYTIEMRLPEPLTIFGTPTELREVIINLIMNALDAMPEGGKLFFDGHVVENSIVSLTVSDTGIGMDEEVQKRIFDPFFSTKKGEGTGLGLSVAYGIVMRHNGRIDCSSRKGQGTTFRIQIPYRAIQMPAPVMPLDSAPSDGSKAPRTLQILIVDDELFIRELFNDVLTEEGHSVTTLDSGLKAIELIGNEPVDLLFTDLSMPEMSGWDVARQAHNLQPDAIIVLTSGWGKDFNREQLSKHGVNYVLPKPVHLDDLTNLVRRVAEGQEISLD
jgi:diguanylate cyclase (GGDEF)-like protein